MLKQLRIAGSSTRASEMAPGATPWGTLLPADGALKLYAVYREVGVTVLDSAQLDASGEKAIGGGPGEGASEKSVGEVLRRRGDRRQVIVITKGGHPTFAPTYMRPERYLTPEVVKRDLKESLERMGLEMVDLY